ncbi:hypothetical protein CIPAW_13G081700 [Carya illinoinensis]|uniref:Secreted protein n=1 Tax=Carya illinoinensis TaxID=32201 RepID=A0A8T1NMY5_CARIL|nr:hypothetical protein CIPAW_13G081700 [Carya illinoinensis]
MSYSGIFLTLIFILSRLSPSLTPFVSLVISGCCEFGKLDCGFVFQSTRCKLREQVAVEAIIGDIIIRRFKFLSIFHCCDFLLENWVVSSSSSRWELIPHLSNIVSSSVFETHGMKLAIVTFAIRSYIDVRRLWVVALR